MIFDLKLFFAGSLVTEVVGSRRVIINNRIVLRRIINSTTVLRRIEYIQFLIIELFDARVE